MNTRPHARIATCLVALFALPLAAHADERRGDGGGRAQVELRVQPRAPARGYYYDNRYSHGQYYPRAGVSVRIAPPGGRELRYRDNPYYYQGGIWYRPWGPRYEVIRPPFGIGIGVLPPFYTTVYFSGVPYYYADGTYYLWEPARREYVVTAAPASDEAASTQPPAEPETYAYPRSGQSESLQASDRYECHDWATRQSGFDPTEPLGGVSAADAGEKRNQYRRAERACLEGRGYSVN